MTKTINITHLSKLANIPVTEEEVKKFEGQFEETLTTVKLLEELDTGTIKETPQVTGLVNVYRDDEIDAARQLTQKDALKNAKTTHNGYFVVPAVINP